jgi:uncharacterized protein YndB with AHSA1/START domain
MKRDATQHVEVRVTQRIDANPDRVFNAWIDPAIAGQWLFATASRPAEHVKIDARAGGAFRFVERRRGADVVHAGTYIEIDRPRRLVFTLTAREDARDRRRVSVEIVPLDTGCVLTLIQERVPPDQAGWIEGRWSGMLYGLETRLAGTSRKVRR